MLRQFAGLFLIVFGGLAAWRYWNGQAGLWTDVLAVAAVVVGVSGLIKPSLVRPIYSGWMVVAFPIGWTVSHIALGAVFYVVFTFVGVVFRLMGRDVLQLKRGKAASYWMPKGAARPGDEYFQERGGAETVRHAVGVSLFPQDQQEVVAAADHRDPGGIWRARVPVQHRGGAVHLHALLTGAACGA
jgi:hypothetical protein